MYETRQHKDKVSRRIDGSGRRAITRNGIAIIQLVLKKYKDDKDARIGWIKNNKVEIVVVEDKFRNDHMLSTSTKVGIDKQGVRNVKKSTLMDFNEDVSNLVKSSASNYENTESGIHVGMQQLSVKIKPEGGVKTIEEGKSQGLSNSGIVVKGNWFPEKGEMHVYHLVGSDLNYTDNMMPVYMWHNDGTPKSQVKKYDFINEYFIKKPKVDIRKEFSIEDREFILLYKSKGLAPNSWPIQDI